MGQIHLSMPKPQAGPEEHSPKGQKSNAISHRNQSPVLTSTFRPPLPNNIEFKITGGGPVLRAPIHPLPSHNGRALDARAILRQSIVFLERLTAHGSKVTLSRMGAAGP